jgi:hypothetical protein
VKTRESGLKSVASEGRLRDAGAQEAESTRQYMSISSARKAVPPCTGPVEHQLAGTQDAERSSFASRE